jgi:DnaJ-class molecular chaperone
VNASIGISCDDRIEISASQEGEKCHFRFAVASHQAHIHLHDIQSAIRLRRALNEELDKVLLGDARQLRPCPACVGDGMFSKGEPGSATYEEWPCRACDGRGHADEEPDTEEWRELRRLLIADAEEEVMK